MTVAALDIAPPRLYGDLAARGEPFWVISPDGVRLRAARFSPAGIPRGAIVMAQGRAEYIEKYGETIANLTAFGWEVLAFDWRGQGGSQRMVSDPRLGYVKDFEEYLRDLAAVRAQVETPGPTVLLAHSMGGSVAVRHAARAPDDFNIVLLSAPMLGLVMSTPMRLLAKTLSAGAVRLGMGERYVLGAGPRTLIEQGFAGNCLTNDEARFARLEELISAHPKLGLGGPSWSWLAAAFRNMRAIAEAKPPLLQVPTRLMIGDSDTVVSLDVARRFAEREPCCDLTLLPGALHEPMIERGEIREIVLATIQEALAEA